MSAWIPPGSGQQVDLGPAFTLTLAEAAVLLGVTPAKLGAWRSRGVGPSYARDGEHSTSPILYDPAEVEAVRKDMQRHRSTEGKAEVSARIDNTEKPPRRTRPARKPR